MASTRRSSLRGDLGEFAGRFGLVPGDGVARPVQLAIELDDEGAHEVYEPEEFEDLRRRLGPGRMRSLGELR
jgi:hypothetical protein